MTNRRFHGFFHHRGHAFGHAQADVVGDRELRPQSGSQARKAFQELREPRPAESDINPYRKMRKQASGIFLGGIQLGDQLLVRSKAFNPALDLARGNVFP